MQVEKPKHNQYDNIWEIRQSGYPSETQIQEVLEKPYFGTDISSSEVTKVGKGLVYRHIENFIRSVLCKTIRLPIWKIVIPNINGSSGAIYYIAECNIYNLIFRGTFGYWGTGPHESALIEAIFEKRGLFFEVRDGDYLLNFLREPKEATSF